MRMKSIVMLLGAAMALSLGAAPAAKGGDPVAQGYPDWQGVTARNYISGREITPSDLRHKVTIVVEIEMNDKIEDAMVQATKLVTRTGMSNGLSFGANWEDTELPRNAIALVCVRNLKSHDDLKEILKTKKGRPQEVSSAVATMSGNGCSLYENVTFTGAPDNGGKFPFAYIMGPTGTEPLFKGELNEAGVKGALEAIAKGRKEIADWPAKWRPFYGNVAEVKFNPQLDKALEKEKKAKVVPLAPVTKAILKNVTAKEADKAKESQVLFDAINQTRSDLLLRIQLEASTCPHRAYYDIQQLLKFWPSEKKRLEDSINKIKLNPEAEPLAKIFCRIMELRSPDFTCKSASDAKKIVVELNKMKKTLEKLKESKTITIQNGALLLDCKLDELISVIPTKVSAS